MYLLTVYLCIIVNIRKLTHIPVHVYNKFYLDMIAIPDFSSGAMENWGLITYRETALLFNEGVSSESNKQRVATVVSHELAHQVWNKKHYIYTKNYKI